jgi:uncharacterized membrane protein YidH (DUF202 family)
VSQVTNEPYDEGRRPERTLLAWRRTALALGLMCVASMRLLAERGGVTVLVLGIVGLVLACVTYVAAGRRFHRVRDALASTGRLIASGPPMATLASCVAALGVACAIYVVAGVTRL